jgi:AcrR family transcriptional regulator
VPRRYTLGKRADQQAATRSRIVAATLDIYRREGFGAASTAAVADAADVAPGTVRNHFPTPEDLAAAAADSILSDHGMPDESTFADLTTPTERVARLAAELAGFFERSASWWEVIQRDRALAAAWSGLEARYYEDLGRLAAAALAADGRDADPATVATVINVVGGPLYFALRGAGLSSGDAVDLECSLLLPWLETERSGANRPVV